jgi:acetyl esterase/lipase
MATPEAPIWKRYKSASADIDPSRVLVAGDSAGGKAISVPLAR